MTASTATKWYVPRQHPSRTSKSPRRSSGTQTTVMRAVGSATFLLPPDDQARLMNDLTTEVGEDVAWETLIHLAAERIVSESVA